MSTPASAMALLHALVGCDFGTKVSVPGVDDRRCTHRAERYVRLYQDGVPLEPMKFCTGHLAFIDTQTTPREGSRG